MKKNYGFQFGMQTCECSFDSEKDAIAYAEAERKSYHGVVYVRLPNGAHYQSSAFSGSSGEHLFWSEWEKVHQM